MPIRHTYGSKSLAGALPHGFSLRAYANPVLAGEVSAVRHCEIDLTNHAIGNLTNPPARWSPPSRKVSRCQGISRRQFLKPTLNPPARPIGLRRCRLRPVHLVQPEVPALPVGVHGHNVLCAEHLANDGHLSTGLVRVQVPCRTPEQPTWTDRSLVLRPVAGRRPWLLHCACHEILPISIAIN